MPQAQAGYEIYIPKLIPITVKFPKIPGNPCLTCPPFDIEIVLDDIYEGMQRGIGTYRDGSQVAVLVDGVAKGQPVLKIYAKEGLYEFAFDQSYYAGEGQYIRSIRTLSAPPRYVEAYGMPSVTGKIAKATGPEPLPW